MIDLAKIFNPERIIKISGRSQFVEVTSSSFSINQVVLSFMNYDAKKTSGNKITAEVKIYMEFNEFLALSYQLLESKKLLQTIKNEQTQAESKGGRYFGYMLSMGGTPKSGLARQGRSRPDGKDESRRLKLMYGDKYPFILRAEAGPGKQEYGKLIKPDGKTDAYVSISMTQEDFIKFFYTISEHIKYYMTAMYTKRMLMPDNYLQELNEYRSSNGLKPLDRTQYHSNVDNNRPPQNNFNQEHSKPPQNSKKNNYHSNTNNNSQFNGNNGNNRPTNPNTNNNSQFNSNNGNSRPTNPNNNYNNQPSNQNNGQSFVNTNQQGSNKEMDFPNNHPNNNNNQKQHSGQNYNQNPNAPFQNFQ